jgi:hypothetical protein
MCINEQILLSQSLWKENGELLAEKKKIRKHLCIWINTIYTAPFPSLDEKKFVANLFDISLSYVNNFCNNYRKRYTKLNKKTISYKFFCQL